MLARLLLLLAACATQALVLPAAASATATARATAPAMKHNDYFKRVANAENGRLRLAVFRCALWPGRARACARARRESRSSPRLPPLPPPSMPARSRAALLRRVAAPDAAGTWIRAGQTTTSTAR